MKEGFPKQTSKDQLRKLVAPVQPVEKLVWSPGNIYIYIKNITVQF